MSVFRRMRDIGTATVNDWLEKTEDPLRLMDRRLAELHKRLVHLQRLACECQVHERQLRGRLAEAQALRKKRERQAELAMKAEEEELCRMALAEKLRYEERCREYAALLADWEETRQAVETELLAVRDEYETLRERRQYYYARVETARLQQQFYRRFHGGQAERDVLQSVEEYVSELELEARVWQDVRMMPPRKRNFLADAAWLSAEMERLRQKLRQKGSEA